MSVRGRFERRLAAGRRGAPGGSGASHGFTLVEILVVVVVVAVAATASLTLLRPPAADPAREAARLAAQLERLALEARLSGRRTAWRCDGPQRLALEILGRDGAGQAAWTPWVAAPEHRLPDGVRVGAVEVDGQAVDCRTRQPQPVFGLAPDFVVELVSADGRTQRLDGDAFGRVRARPADGG